MQQFYAFKYIITLRRCIILVCQKATLVFQTTNCSWYIFYSNILQNWIKIKGTIWTITNNLTKKVRLILVSACTLSIMFLQLWKWTDANHKNSWFWIHELKWIITSFAEAVLHSVKSRCLGTRLLNFISALTPPRPGWVLYPPCASVSSSVW